MQRGGEHGKPVLEALEAPKIGFGLQNNSERCGDCISHVPRERYDIDRASGFVGNDDQAVMRTDARSGASSSALDPRILDEPRGGELCLSVFQPKYRHPRSMSQGESLCEAGLHDWIHEERASTPLNRLLWSRKHSLARSQIEYGGSNVSRARLATAKCREARRQFGVSGGCR